MAVSRNAQEFLERAGLTRATVPPRPRLDVTELKVHLLPLEAPMPEQQVLRDYDGQHPPDRGVTKPWPNQ